MSSTELENKIRELRQLQSLIDEAQAEVETIKGVLKAHMGEREELRVGEYKITWKPVTARRMDIEAIRKANPMLCDMFTREATIRRFCVV